MTDEKKDRARPRLGAVFTLLSRIAEFPDETSRLLDASRSRALRVTPDKATMALLGDLARQEPGLSLATIPVTDEDGAFGSGRPRPRRNTRPSVSIGDLFTLLTAVGKDPTKTAALMEASKADDLRLLIHRPTVAALRELTHTQPTLTVASIAVTDPWGAFG